MSSIYTENLRIYNAEQFKLSVSEVGPTSIYLAVGRSYPWPNDAVPTQANSTVATSNEVWKNMIGAKLVSGNDIRHVVPRHDWTYGTIYTPYDELLPLYEPGANFYVVTSDWNVYKCLNNNNDQPSTVKPTQTITNTAIDEADGYTWKYMYTVTAEERLRFTTGSYIPVRTLQTDNNSLQWQVQEAAIDGGIEAIKLTDPGSGYTTAPTITIVGDGANANAVAVIDPSSNTVERITITNPGSGYTYASVSIVGVGSSAAGKAAISPPGGHGKDPIRELGGSQILINVRLNNTENGKMPTDNEFRQISLIQDPRIAVTGDLATSVIYNQTMRLTTSPGSSNFVEDEQVYQGSSPGTATFRAIVNAWDSGNNIMKVTNVEGTPTADVIVGATSATIRYVESITNKELLDYSGNLLYVDNVTPIQRADDQTEDIKIVLKF